MTPLLGPEAQSCWDPPFPTLSLSRLNDLPGNLSASQFEDAILAAFNAAKTAQPESLKVRKGGLPPLTSAKFNSRVLVQAFCCASEFREA